MKDGATGNNMAHHVVVDASDPVFQSKRLIKLAIESPELLLEKNTFGIQPVSLLEGDGNSNTTSNFFTDIKGWVKKKLGKTSLGGVLDTIRKDNIINEKVQKNLAGEFKKYMVDNDDTVEENNRKIIREKLVEFKDLVHDKLKYNNILCINVYAFCYKVYEQLYSNREGFNSVTGYCSMFIKSLEIDEYTIYRRYRIPKKMVNETFVNEWQTTLLQWYKQIVIDKFWDKITFYLRNNYDVANKRFTGSIKKFLYDYLEKYYLTMFEFTKNIQKEFKNEHIAWNFHEIINVHVKGQMDFNLIDKDVLGEKVIKFMVDKLIPAIKSDYDSIVSYVVDVDVPEKVHIKNNVIQVINDCLQSYNYIQTNANGKPHFVNVNDISDILDSVISYMNKHEKDLKGVELKNVLYEIKSLN